MKTFKDVLFSSRAWLVHHNKIIQYYNKNFPIQKPTKDENRIIRQVFIVYRRSVQNWKFSSIFRKTHTIELHPNILFSKHSIERNESQSFNSISNRFSAPICKKIIMIWKIVSLFPMSWVYVFCLCTYGKYCLDFEAKSDFCEFSTGRK